MKYYSYHGALYRPDVLDGALVLRKAVGATKVVDGVTYRLNQNHRWERVGGESPGQLSLLANIDAEPIGAAYMDAALPLRERLHSLVQVFGETDDYDEFVDNHLTPFAQTLPADDFAPGGVVEMQSTLLDMADELDDYSVTDDIEHGIDAIRTGKPWPPWRE